MNLLRATASALVLTSFAVGACANGISYISSLGGYMLHMSGSTAVTSHWQGQDAIKGFNGHGQIQMNNVCLTGRNGNQPLTWEGCSDSPEQRWTLSGGRLNNEGGWCAEAEGKQAGPGVRVMAWQCSRASNQQWRAHGIVSAKTIAAQIADPKARAAFELNAANAPAGSVLSTTTGKMVAAGGGNMAAAGSGNMISAGGGYMVAAGGGN